MTSRTTFLGARATRLGASEEGASPGGARRIGTVLVAYAGVGAAAAAIAWTFGRDPLSCDAWLGTQGAAGALVSLGVGVCIGSMTVVASRAMVRRTAWARALHAALRPAVVGAGDASIAAMAVASAAAEEVLFRGLLVPIVGVVLSAILFGALHQLRGRARWGWMAWATLMGVLFGATFAATGSLAGPIVAHAMINGSNLRFLRDNDPSPRARALGGLLRRS
jgi:membrane protease YdiL (CAAX protease family)